MHSPTKLKLKLRFRWFQLTRSRASHAASRAAGRRPETPAAAAPGAPGLPPLAGATAAACGRKYVQNFLLSYQEAAEKNVSQWNT